MTDHAGPAGLSLRQLRSNYWSEQAVAEMLAETACDDLDQYLWKLSLGAKSAYLVEAERKEQERQRIVLAYLTAHS